MNKIEILKGLLIAQASIKDMSADQLCRNAQKILDGPVYESIIQPGYVKAEAFDKVGLTHWTNIARRREVKGGRALDPSDADDVVLAKEIVKAAMAAGEQTFRAAIGVAV